MTRLLLTLILALGCASHARAAAPDDDADSSPKTHAFRGVIRGLTADHRHATIQHEAVPNYMPAMTMEFNLRDTNELATLAIGDRITFTLTVAGDTHWISGLRKADTTLTPAPPTAQAGTEPGKGRELKRGDPMPDAEFTAEDGRKLRWSDFRGQAVAFTFFFTRCPLPDYCPRMSQDFAEARTLLLAHPAVTNWQFLSLSFDGDFDQPAVLSAYAKGYRRENPAHWIFAAASTDVLRELGPRLDLMVRRDAEGGISHNLRTVVIDTEGRIARQFDGNQWKPQELAEALLAAARKPASR